MTFRHEAFLYSCPEEFLAESTAFIREGMENGDPTLVIVAADKVSGLRAELGGDLEGVAFADIGEVGHNPARLIPVWRDFVEDHRGRPRLRGLGEPVGPERGEAELVECDRHEVLLNVAFPDDPDFWLVCPYATTQLAQAELAAARRSHPFLFEAGRRAESPGYRPVVSVERLLGERLCAPPECASAMRFDAGLLTALRAFVSTHGDRAGLDPERTADLVLSVNELASNSIQYGGGSGQLSIWQSDEVLLCEVRDGGYISDPLVGRKAPGMAPESSRGLWVVNQLCDLVQVRSSYEGTVVRLHMSTDRPLRHGRS
jgi:anti-sigma regulatory factor (Ser/Thr protein kinase)